MAPCWKCHKDGGVGSANNVAQDYRKIKKNGPSKVKYFR